MERNIYGEKQVVNKPNRDGVKELFLRSKQLFAHSVDKPKIVIPIGAKTVTETVKRNVVGKKHDEMYVHHGYHTVPVYNTVYQPQVVSVTHFSLSLSA